MYIYICLTGCCPKNIKTNDPIYNTHVVLPEFRGCHLITIINQL